MFGWEQRPFQRVVRWTKKELIDRILSFHCPSLRSPQRNRNGPSFICLPRWHWRRYGRQSSFCLHFCFDAPMRTTVIVWSRGTKVDADSQALVCRSLRSLIGSLINKILVFDRVGVLLVRYLIQQRLTQL